MSDGSQSAFKFDIYDVESIQLKVRSPSEGSRGMDRLTTRIDRDSEDFDSRRESNLALAEALRTQLDAAKEGGGGKYAERHRAVSYTHLTLPTILLV